MHFTFDLHQYSTSTSLFKHCWLDCSEYHRMNSKVCGRMVWWWAVGGRNPCRSVSDGFCSPALGVPTEAWNKCSGYNFWIYPWCWPRPPPRRRWAGEGRPAGDCTHMTGSHSPRRSAQPAGAAAAGCGCGPLAWLSASAVPQSRRTNSNTTSDSRFFRPALPLNSWAQSYSWTLCRWWWPATVGSGCRLHYNSSLRTVSQSREISNWHYFRPDRALRARTW